jgi:hypothetical protein
MRQRLPNSLAVAMVILPLPSVRMARAAEARCALSVAEPAKNLLHICDGPDQIGIAIGGCREHERHHLVTTSA